MAILVAMDTLNGSGNRTVTLSDTSVSLFIVNDGGGDLTFTAINGGKAVFSQTLKASEDFNERINPFTHVMISAGTGVSYRGFVRVERDGGRK